MTYPTHIINNIYFAKIVIRKLKDNIERITKHFPDPKCKEKNIGLSPNASELDKAKYDIGYWEDLFVSLSGTIQQLKNLIK